MKKLIRKIVIGTIAISVLVLSNPASLTFANHTSNNSRVLIAQESDSLTEIKKKLIEAKNDLAKAQNDLTELTNSYQEEATKITNEISKLNYKKTEDIPIITKLNLDLVERKAKYNNDEAVFKTKIQNIQNRIRQYEEQISILEGPSGPGYGIPFKPSLAPFTNIKGTSPAGTLNLILQIIAGGLLYLATPIAIIMVIVNGMKIQAGGENASAAKKGLIWAGAGLLIIMLSVVIIRFVLDVILSTDEGATSVLNLFS